MLPRAVASRRDCCLLEQTTNDFSIRMMPTWSGDRLRGFAKQTCVFAILRIDWDRVSKTRVALYRKEDGSCPFIEWFDVVSHGLAKERVVPPKEIDRAVERKKRFAANPAKHTYEEA